MDEFANGAASVELPTKFADERSDYIASVSDSHEIAVMAGAMSTASVPLTLDGECHGTLAVRSLTANAFGKKDTALLTQIAALIIGQVSDSNGSGLRNGPASEFRQGRDTLSEKPAHVTANGQLHSQLRNETNLLEVLGEIGMAMTSCQDSEHIYGRFADLVRRIIPFDRITISDVDLEQNTTAHRYTNGGDIPGHASGWEGELRGLAAEACDSGQIISFTPNDEREFFEKFHPDATNFESGLRSFLAIPINFGAELIGYMHLQSEIPDLYTRKHEDIGRRIVSHISGAMMRHQLQNTLEEQAREKALLADLSLIVNTSLDLATTTDRFAVRLRQDVPFDRLVLAEIGKDSRTGFIRICNGAKVGGRSEGTYFSLDDTIVGRLSRSGQTLVVQGLAKDEVIERYPGLRNGVETGLKSFIFVPLISAENVISVIAIFSQEANAFSRRHVGLAERVASQIAGPVANAMLHADLARESQERALLAKVGRDISSSPNIGDIFQQFTDSMAELLKFDRVTVTECDLSDGIGMNLFTIGEVFAGRQANEAFPLEGSFMLDSVIGRNDACIVQGSELNQIASRYPSMAARTAAGYWSFIFTLVYLRDNKAAVMTLASFETEAYTCANLSLAQRISQQITGVITNYRLNKELEHESKEREILAEIGRNATSSLDLPDVYQNIAQSLSTVLTCDRIAINIVNLSQRRVVVRFSSGTRSLDAKTVHDVPFEDTLTGAVAMSNSPILRQNDSLDNCEGEIPGLLLIREMGLQSSLAVPLRVNDEIIGVLKIHSKDRSAYTSRDLYLVERIGNQIAGPIANSDLYRRLEEEASDRQTLAEIGRSATSSLNLDDVYENVNRTLPQLIPFDRMTLRLMGVGPNTAVQTYYMSEPASSDITLGNRGPFSGTAAEIAANTGQAMIVSENMIDSIAKTHPESADALTHYRSLMIIPIISNKSVIAILGLRKLERNVYNGRHLELGEAVATHLASAITNAQLHDIAEHEAREKDMLAELSRTLNSSLNASIPHEFFKHTLGHLISFDRVAICMIDMKRDRMVETFVSGFEETEWQPSDIWPLKDTYTEIVARTKKGFILDAGYLNDIKIRFPEWSKKAASNLQSAIIVPLISDNDVIGAMNFRSVSPGVYSNRDLRAAERIAAQISGALANHRLLERLQASNSELRTLSARIVEVQERERRYIANELHDEVGQILTGVKLNLESSLKVLTGQSKSQVADSIDLIANLTDRVRDLSLELRPAVLDDLGLLPALESHIKRYFAQTRIAVNFKHRGLDHRFSPNVETAAYRIAQEALTNIARYSGTRQAFVKIHIDGNTLSLRVEDRGAGFDVDQVIAAGRASGLAGMRERATSLGGVFRIESRPGAGTEVAVELPLNQ